MILTLILVALTLAVLAMLLSPFVRKSSLAASQRVDYDIVIYRDQLAEIDRDAERGLLDADQAEAARREIYRRMLAAEDAENEAAQKKEKGRKGSRGRLIPALVILILLPVGAGVLYAHLGAPELPGKPFAARKNDPDFALATEAEQLADRLEKKPEAEGYKRLADTYFTLKRYDQATAAYQKVIDLKGGNALIWSELGEAIALSHDSLVVSEAYQAFVKALQLDSHDQRARFYMGLAESQIGELRHAVAIWKDLEKDSPADAPWMPMVKEHIAAFAKEGGFDPSSVEPAPPSLKGPHGFGTMTTSSKPMAPSAGPADVPPEAAASIMAMKPDDQQAMVRQMVGRLADKMKNNPDDLDGWQRLARAYRVLGESAKAKEAESKVEALQAKSPQTGR